MSADASEFRPAPRRRVFLMRHAEVDYSDKDGRPVHPDHAVLSPRGLEQPSAPALPLAGVPPDGVIPPAMPRAAQAAEVYPADHPLPITPDERWREIQTGKIGYIAAESR